MRQSRVSITRVPPLDYPGGVPTEPVGRRLAEQLLAAAEHVSILAEGEQAKQRPDGVAVMEGSVARPTEVPAAFEGIALLLLAYPDPSTA